MQFTAKISNRDYNVEYENDSIFVNGKEIHFSDFMTDNMGGFSFVHDNQRFNGYINNTGDQQFLVFCGFEFPISIETERDRLLKIASASSANSKHHFVIKANMPGLVVRVLAEIGAKVKKGQTILILEAMKMENELKATADGTIERILVAENQVVEKGDLMIVIN